MLRFHKKVLPRALSLTASVAESRLNATASAWPLSHCRQRGW